jgi:hypothetical protein
LKFLTFLKKTDFFLLPTRLYSGKKQIYDPYYIKPELALPEKSCLSAGILDLEFKKNIFVLPRPTANKVRPVFFDSQKKVNN